MLKKISLLMLVATSVFAGSVKYPEYTLKPAVARNFHAYPSKSDDYAESWSYRFVFDNGTRLLTNYTLAKIPMKGIKCALEASFYNFKGKNHSVGREYAKKNFKASTSPHSIEMTKLFKMEGLPGKNHRILFDARKKAGYFVDLKFDSAVKGKRMGDGLFKLNNSPTRQFVSIPWGRVSGKIAVGKDTVEVTGYGYMVHTSHTRSPAEAAKWSMELSAPAGDFVAQIFMAKKKFGGQPWGTAIKRTADGWTVLKPVAIEGLKLHKKQRDFNIVWSDGSQTQVKAKDMHTYKPINNVDGFVAQRAVKMVVGDVRMYRGRSKAGGQVLDYLISGAK